MNNLKELIIQKGLFEIIPYVKGLYLKQRYMLLSYESITHAEQRLIEKMQAIKEEKEKELKTTGHTSWGVKDRARWNVNIEGFDVDIMDYVNKGVWDFYHYAHICLDMIAQIVNVVAYDPNMRKSEDNINVREVYKNLPKEYESIKKILIEFENSEDYRYIQAADNYIKHINAIGIKLNTKNILDDFDSFVINDFVYHKRKYNGGIVSDITRGSKDFVIDATNRFFETLMTNDNAVANKNIITDIKYESLTKGNITEYLSFFIDINSPELDTMELFGGDTIYVKPLAVDKEYNIYEDKTFDFDIIFLRQEGTENIIGKAIKECTSKTNYYKKYKIVSCTNEDYKKYVMDFKTNYKRVKISNMLAYSGIEKRII